MAIDIFEFQMTEPKNVVALDFETTGLGVYKSGIKVTSISLSRYIKGKIHNIFIDDEHKIYKTLQNLANNKVPVIVYNYGFEALVMHCKYPGIKLNVTGDVLRLVQQEGTQWGKRAFSLKNAVVMLLPRKYHGYENDIKNWIIENVTYLAADGKTKSPNSLNWGRFIYLAPHDKLKRYNELDTEMTLRIYEAIWEKWFVEEPEYLKSKHKNITDDELYTIEEMSFDHAIYLLNCERVARAEARGMQVDIYELLCGFHSAKNKLETMESRFFEQHKDGIAEVQRRRAKSLWLEKQNTLKSKKYLEIWTLEYAKSKIKPFNYNSDLDLKMLLVDVYGQVPKYFSKKTKRPSFSAKVMHQWTGIDILKEKGALEQAMKQARNLIYLSFEDGLYHPSIKVAGTTTGRLAGGKFDG